MREYPKTATSRSHGCFCKPAASPANREDDGREESEECSRHSFLLHQPAAVPMTIHVCFIFPPLVAFVLRDWR